MIFFSCSAHSHALSPLQWQSVFLWLKSPCLLSLLSFQQNLLHFPCLLYAEFFFYWIVVVSNWKWTQRSNSVSSGSDLTVGSVCPWHICRTNSYVGFHKVLVVSQLASSSVLLGMEQRGCSKLGCVSFGSTHLPHLWEMVLKSNWVRDEEHGLMDSAYSFLCDDQPHKSLYISSNQMALKQRNRCLAGGCKQMFWACLSFLVQVWWSCF